MSRFAIVSPLIWSRTKVRGLSDAARTLLLYFLTCQSTMPIPGVVLGGPATHAEALERSMAWFEKALKELIAAGVRVRFDRQARFIWMETAVTKHQPPSNAAQVRAWSKAWDQIPDCPTKLELWKALEVACRHLVGTAINQRGGVLEPFDELFARPSEVGAPGPIEERTPPRARRKGGARTVLGSGEGVAGAVLGSGQGSAEGGARTRLAGGDEGCSDQDHDHRHQQQQEQKECAPVDAPARERTSPSRRLHSGGDNARDGYHHVFDTFVARYAEQNGIKPTVNPKLGGQIKHLLQQHEAGEIQRRINVLFDGHGPSFLRPPYDFGTIVQHFDKLVKPTVATIGAAPARRDHATGTALERFDG